MAQQGIRIPDSLMKNLENQEKQSVLVKKMISSDSLAKSASADSLPDSLQEKKDEAGAAQDTSVYERIIRGETIHPDTILSRIDIFGYSIFRQGGTPRHDAAAQLSVPADYMIAAGDEVIIFMWGRINEEHRLTVDRDGNINIPRIGPIAVAGQPFHIMQKTISERIQSIEGVQSSVTMGTLRSISLYVVGEVTRPGQYTLSALSNVTDALFAAGGVTKRGSLRNVQLMRSGRLVTTIDFYDFLLSGNNFGTLRLQAGDVLFVPVVKAMAAVAGSVRRSALYECKGKTTLKEIIELAGGFTPAAWVNRIQIDRFKDNSYQVVLDLDAPSSKQLPDVFIEDGDIIRVFHIYDRDKNAVFLTGNVKRPGKYEYKEGMRIRDIIRSYDNLLPETHLDYAAVQRFNPPKFTESLLSFSLREALDDSTSQANIALAPYDNIIIYNRDFFEPDRTVTIAGAVTSPGKYRLLDNMKIKDLVLQAGGLTDAASVERGELYRRIFDDDNVRTEKTDFCVRCAMQDDPSHNLVLGKLDHVYVREKMGWEEIRKVTFLGEVVFPGEYVLLPDETLGQLITRAGGFSENAYLAAAVFSRMSIKKMEQQRNEEYIRTLESNISQMSAEMAAKEQSAEAQSLLSVQMRLLDRIKKIKPVGRVVLDLTDRKSYENFMLEDGDTLFVPKTMNTVSVMGEVFNPATFQLDMRKAEVRNYLSQAGGFKETADRRSVYVVRANGSVISAKHARIQSYRLSPGDVVVVPQKLRYVSGYKVFTETVDAVYKVAMTAAVVFTLLNK